MSDGHPLWGCLSGVVNWQPTAGEPHRCVWFGSLSVLFEMEFVANIKNWEILLKNPHFQLVLKIWKIWQQ